MTDSKTNQPDPVSVIDRTEQAHTLLQPARLELMGLLDAPKSAAALARELDLPRQRINYHLRALESVELIECVEERKKGNVTERLYRRTGSSYAISASTLGSLGPEPADVGDQFSSGYQIAKASQVIEELGALRVAAKAAKKKLPTFALDVDLRFANAEARNAFADDLAAAVADLVRKHHDDKAKGGRFFRFYLGGYPRPAARS